MLLGGVEFFTHEHEVWFRTDDTNVAQLTENNCELINAVVEHMSTFYPKAYEALAHEYGGCAKNQRFYRFRIACRFIKCNFAPLDNVPDFTAKNGFSFEYVQCPLRGECRYECVICRPEFNHKLSSAEMRVMELWYSGLSEDAIATKICLSPHTIHNHIRNSYLKLGVSSRSEFVRVASAKGIFK